MPKSPRKKVAAKSSAPQARRAVAKKTIAAKKANKKPSIAALVTDALSDLKAQQVNCLDVRHLTSVTDTMIIAGGRSDRHVRALADAVLERCKEAGIAPLGIEGQEAGEWVLVDLADVVVHVMLPRVREFYNLEKLWDISARGEALEG
jgi:ribosome-associated protein